jgi:tetratricopeptide (TPR) repeat protein
LTQALEIKPLDPLVLFKRGISYFKNEEYKLCIKDLYKSYEKKPISPYEAELHYHLGISFANLETFDKAIEPLS